MAPELSLVTDLATILIAAGIFTVISKALKQPIILGYIVAGFVVGPNLGWFPQFDAESVHKWSELGIIFLMFGLGLEFNLKKLLNVGSTAIIAAVTICLGMFMLGSTTGSLLGWSVMESIFLGGMMGMSSTTIVLKAYDDLGIMGKSHSSLVFGILVVEDLLAVLMMVFFSTIAVSNKVSGTDMLISLAKLVMFLVLCFLTGIYVIPSMLNRVKKYISDEILILISIGLCFFMVVLANLSGFSSALGAFLIGSILSSLTIGERVAHLTVNIKNFFGAIFFVSVGMMVNPSVIAGNWLTILIITIVAMVGILTFSTIGVLFAGKDLNTALHVGFSLTQLGEFSFIIAGLGTSLGVINDVIYPVIIAVSVITTFTTPYMIKAADPASAKLHKLLPKRILARLQRKSQPVSEMNRAEKSEWKVFLKKYLTRVSIYFILLVGLSIFIKKYLALIIQGLIPRLSGNMLTFTNIAVALSLMSPFLFGLAVNRGELKKISESLIMRDSRARIPILAATIFRIYLAVEFALSAILMFMELSGWLLLILFIALVFLFIIARRHNRQYYNLETKFMKNLREREELQKRNAPVSSTIKESFTGYDIGTSEIVLDSDFIYAGRSLREMPFRHGSGVNIVKIQRGSKSILIPSGDECLFPGDRIVAVGTREQLEKFGGIVKSSTVKSEPVTEDFVVEKLSIDKGSHLVGVELKDAGFRPSGCLLVNVERDGEMITNPGKNFRFREGDVIWLAGLRSSVEWFRN